MWFLGFLVSCVSDGTGASYPAADLVRFNGATLNRGSFDPRAGDVIVPAPTDAGHEWALAIGEGVVIAGVPELGVVRAYALDGTDDDAGALVAEGTVLEGYGASVAARGNTVYVGAPEANAGPEQAGAGALARLEEGGDRVLGQSAQGHFGSAIAACGDLHGDGSPDVLVAAPWEGDLAGRVYVLSDGAAADDTTNLRFVSGAAPGDNFGGALGCTGDLLDDGAPDVVIASPFGSGALGVAGEGSVSVWTAAGFAAGTPAATLFDASAGTGAGGPASFGAALATCRFRESGKDDLVVGAPGALDGEGAAYVFFGRDALQDGAAPSVTLRGDSSGARFGAELACADLDGDGLDELFVGAPGQDAADGTLEAGAVYGFGGVGLATGTLPASLAGWQFAADRAFLRAGRSFLAGDLDGDGLAELVFLVRQPARSTEATAQ